VQRTQNRKSDSEICPETVDRKVYRSTEPLSQLKDRLTEHRYWSTESLKFFNSTVDRTGTGRPNYWVR